MEIETSTESNKKGDFEKPHIDEGIYTATLLDVKEISEGTYGPRLAFVYEANGVELALVCYKPKIATPENKLGETLMAHGVDLKTGKINTDNLPKKTVKAWVEDYEYEKEGKKYKASSISKVKPLD